MLPHSSSPRPAPHAPLPVSLTLGLVGKWVARYRPVTVGLNLPLHWDRFQIASRSAARSPVTRAAWVSLRWVLMGASFAQSTWPGLTAGFKVSSYSLPRKACSRIFSIWSRSSGWICASQHWGKLPPGESRKLCDVAGVHLLIVSLCLTHDRVFQKH